MLYHEEHKYVDNSMIIREWNKINKQCIVLVVVRDKIINVAIFIIYSNKNPI